MIQYHTPSNSQSSWRPHIYDPSRNQYSIFRIMDTSVVEIPLDNSHSLPVIIPSYSSHSILSYTRNPYQLNILLLYQDSYQLNILLLYRNTSQLTPHASTRNSYQLILTHYIRPPSNITNQSHVMFQ